MLRLFLALLLVSLTILAAMIWSGKYDGSPDPAARFEIEAVRLKPDRGYVWLEAHLKKSGDKDHDLRKPVRLITGDGIEHEPADTTFSGSPETGFTEIWFKFWLEKKALEGPMVLKLNDAELMVKSTAETPELPAGKDTVFRSSKWKKSWLGF
ncbi:hypothetical protein ACFSSA_01515 [Luteolibacter algae]|uniref:Uncharacterized protein n=1 Tax=Luteolibacter algae TaxID=454151 RepID=A0ABW5D3T9_9BACT